jgi:hypothetical protein
MHDQLAGTPSHYHRKIMRKPQNPKAAPAKRKIIPDSLGYHVTQPRKDLIANERQKLASAVVIGGQEMQFKDGLLVIGKPPSAET